MLHKEEVCIDQGAQIHSHLQWIQDGDKDSKFFFNFLNKNIVVESVLGLLQVDFHLKKTQMVFKVCFVSIFRIFFHLTL